GVPGSHVSHDSAHIQILSYQAKGRTFRLRLREGHAAQQVDAGADPRTEFLQRLPLEGAADLPVGPSLLEKKMLLHLASEGLEEEVELPVLRSKLRERGQEIVDVEMLLEDAVQASSCLRRRSPGHRRIKHFLFKAQMHPERSL